MKNGVFSVEGRLASFVKSKGGHYIKIEIQPMDIPEELNQAGINQRFMIAFSPLGDFDEDVGEGDRVVQQAGILCRSKTFWEFLRTLETGRHAVINTEEDAADYLKFVTGVDSRTEYKTSEVARERFRKLHAKYESYIERTSEL